MKTNFFKTGAIFLLALALTVGATAQELTTAMNSTLVPQSWSNLPIVNGEDVKGGMHELGMVDISGGAQAAINAESALPSSKRTLGMVVGLFEEEDLNGVAVAGQYRQYILMATDTWQEILVTSAWKAGTTYAAGDPVSYQGATYFSVAGGLSLGTFALDVAADSWYGVSNAGVANLSKITLAGSDLDGVAKNGSEITVVAGDVVGSETQIVSSKALVEYVSDQLDDIIEAGTIAGQTLVWNGSSWEASSALTNDGTDVTATGTVTADQLSTTEFTVDDTGNVTTTGNISGATITTTGDASIGGNANVTGNVTAEDITAIGDLSGATLNIGTDALTVDGSGNTATDGTLTVEGVATMNGNVVLNDNATDITTVNGSLILTDDMMLDSVAVTGITTSVATTLTATDDNLITEGAVKKYVDDQLGTGGSLYYGSAGAFSASPLASAATIEGLTDFITKSSISGTGIVLDIDEFFYIAVPTTWGALNMFIDGSPIFDGFVKTIVDGYYVYVMQFKIDNQTNDVNLTFAIK